MVESIEDRENIFIWLLSSLGLWLPMTQANIDDFIYQEILFVDKNLPLNIPLEVHWRF